MTLLADIKVSLRITTDVYDSEVRGLIDAARFDMERAGVDPTLLALDPTTRDLPNEFVKQAVRCYAKAHFGYDNPESERLDASYRRIVCDLMNSSHNIAAMELEEPAESVLEPVSDEVAEPEVETPEESGDGQQETPGEVDG